MLNLFDATQFLSHCSQRPGVYRMLDAQGQLLYVGKAKNLKKRLSSYFRSSGLAPKTAALVSRIAQIELSITQNETEALILEQNLIKEWLPPYNILLRDDKSYPYILVSHGPYPRLSLHRGAKNPKAGRYFGPYPSSGAVRDTLNLLQKTFLVRLCEDSQFSNRSRPCLQHQIQRCKAPCVYPIDPQEYAEDIRCCTLFLEGRSNTLTAELATRMEERAAVLDFEGAAQLRDQIAQLRNIQSQQDMESKQENLDVIVAVVQGAQTVIGLMSVRNGRVLGDQHFFPHLALETEAPEVLLAFLEQHYLGTTESNIPEQLIVSHTHEGFEPLIQALSSLKGRKVSINYPHRGIRLRWLHTAQQNAELALSHRTQDRQQIAQRLEALQNALGFNQAIQRLECFDVSHAQGEATVASCVAFGPEGSIKSDYRCYNIHQISTGDDYAALEHALRKRFTSSDAQANKHPDVLLIDGGAGQLQRARRTLAELGLNMPLLAVAKGHTRKAGLESLYLNTPDQALNLAPQSPALHLIQQVRDEAHRFAITGNRTRLNKARRTSTLESIRGVGPNRRRELLRYFGGLQALKNASIEEIIRVPGISQRLAESIYNSLHHE
ncbi:excinuclease ABC subunit C [Azomonas agilis]|uniref:UvrABC system protein C n=1 Tax=Azomonas agilis TaxID=116849 RepID=A0A562I0D5_9GAMM|nr:excinuclease ABC subunit UvrC [Azomonas agilis]TWH64095.1 excinuclease ABC subunit C [Azomonas agilis]